MRYGNGFIFQGNKGFVRGGFCVSEGRFESVFEGDGSFDVDLKGAYVIPGLVDIHIHGANGFDFSDGDTDGLIRMGRFLAGRGITAFAPTSMTLGYDALKKAFASAVSYREANPAGGARLLGIHMEGPYLSEKKKGSQNEKYLRNPDTEGFLELFRGCGGLIKIVDIAPELSGAAEFAREVSEICRVSVAHTDADYDTAKEIFDAGATHLTHLYNAMSAFNHRAPGVIGAASEDVRVMAELICDGYHVHPSAVRAAFLLFPDRICLISDALRCLGMPDGRYELGGQEVFLSDGAARLAGGTLAGSACDLYTCMQRAVSFGIPKETAVRAATIVPARQLGAEDECGSITPGIPADFIICDSELNREKVFLRGVENNLALY